MCITFRTKMFMLLSTPVRFREQAGSFSKGTTHTIFQLEDLNPFVIPVNFKFLPKKVQNVMHIKTLGFQTFYKIPINLMLHWP